jgi:hypothetical protein
MKDGLQHLRRAASLIAQRLRITAATRRDSVRIAAYRHHAT